MASNPRPLVGLVAGVAAGLVASAVMAAFQSRAGKLLPPQQGDAEPVTVKAADMVSEMVTGEAVPEPYRAEAGSAVHYIVGGVLGGIYGVLAEYHPEASAGFGSAYGVVTSALLDKGAVLVPSLAPTPGAMPIATHAYGAASHLLFGWVLEGTRRLLAGRR